MAPKKKGGKGAKGPKGSGGMVDGVSMAEMSREQLEGFTLRIKEELEREREERNYFQLERDKLRTFWEITWQQHEEFRAQIRNNDRALEEAAEDHQSTIKMYKEKVKHLLFEHQCNLTNLKAERMVALKLAEEEYTTQEISLLQDKYSLKNQITEAEIANEGFMKELSLKHGEEMSNIRESFVLRLEEIAAKSDDRLDQLRDYFTLKNRTELAEVEERKEAQIAQIISSYEAQYKDLKQYHYDVTLNNLSLISCLKEELVELKDKNEESDKIMNKLKEANARLTKPLEFAHGRVKELEKEVGQYKKDKESLMNLQKRLSGLSKQNEKITYERDELKLNFERLQEELEEVKKHYSSVIFETQKRNGIKKTMLEKKIEYLEEELEERELKLAHIISKANLDPKCVMEANEKIERVREIREKKMQELNLELGRAVKAHDQLLDLLFQKAREAGFELDIQGTDSPLQYLRPKLKDIIVSSSARVL